MATMRYTTIIAVLALFVVGQAADPLFQLNFDVHPPEENTKCTKLTNLLEAFWQSLPFRTPSIHGIDNNYIIFSQKNINTRVTGIFYRKLDYSAETRMKLACGLAAVKNISDLVPLYSPTSLPSEESYRHDYHRAVQSLRDMGLEALKDMGDFAGLINYTMNITGFPKFPLNVYDMRMSRALGDRLLEHIHLWNPNMEMTEETKQAFASALMGETSLPFRVMTGMDWSNIRGMVEYVHTYTHSLKLLSSIISMFDEMGLLDLQ